jgi:hypothetical protein
MKLSFLIRQVPAAYPFISGPEKDHVNKDTREISKIQRDHAVEFSLRMLLAQTETILKSLPANCNGKRRDALIRSKSITACGETIRSTPPVEISTKENKYEKNNPK